MGLISVPINEDEKREDAHRTVQFYQTQQLTLIEFDKRYFLYTGLEGFFWQYPVFVFRLVLGRCICLPKWTHIDPKMMRKNNIKQFVFITNRVFPSKEFVSPHISITKTTIVTKSGEGCAVNDMLGLLNILRMPGFVVMC